jgi:hypothetical protein
MNRVGSFNKIAPAGALFFLLSFAPDVSVTSPVRVPRYC